MQILEGNRDFSFQEMNLHFALPSHTHYANKDLNFTLVICSNVIDPTDWDFPAQKDI